MKEFFLPTEKNNYQPRLLSRFALYAYLFVFLFVNVGFTFVIPAKVSAQINIDLIYDYHNQERAKRGLSTLSINTQLVESATSKAQAMLAANCWSHYCPNGKSPWDFFEEAGYDYIFAGENLAEGFLDTDKLMQAWMNSPTHRANIINENFSEIGIGYATGNYQNNENNIVIVVHFGSRITVETPDNLPQTGSDTSVVKFTNPTDNKFLKSNTPEFYGTAPLNSTVMINVNGNFIGKTTSDGINFNYKLDTPLSDDSYQLYAEAYTSTNTFIGTSRTLIFTIDTTIPVPDKALFDVTSVITKGDTRYITINYVDSSIHRLIEKISSTGSERTSSGNINLELPWDFVEIHPNLIFEIYDNAGNKAEIELPAQDIISLAEECLEEVNARQSSFDLFSKQGLENIKLTVNWGFVSFLSTLFGIDFFFLSKTGLTNLERSKSHLNLIIYIILLLILVIGVSSGNILTGTAK